MGLPNGLPPHLAGLLDTDGMGRRACVRVTALQHFGRQAQVGEVEDGHPSAPGWLGKIRIEMETTVFKMGLPSKPCTWPSTKTANPAS
jgi:hypothetical protein